MNWKQGETVLLNWHKDLMKEQPNDEMYKQRFPEQDQWNGKTDENWEYNVNKPSTSVFKKILKQEYHEYTDTY